MVKPIPARRLSRRSSASLHEEDLSASEESSLRAEPTEPSEDSSVLNSRSPRLEASTSEVGDRTEAEVLSSAEQSPVNKSENCGGDDCVSLPSIPSTSGSGGPQCTSRHAEKHASREVCSYPSHAGHENVFNGTSQTVNSDSSCPCLQSSSHNHFVSPCALAQGVTQQTAALSQDLYLRFLHEEIRVANIRGPPCLSPWQAVTLDRQYYNNLNATFRARRNLRQIADVFAVSEQRELVRQKAASVSIESLDFNSFQDLLYGLFQEGGVTSERVVVLFFFCSDLIIRSLQEQLTSGFHHLLDWSQLYIAGTFSVWIEQHGGWVAVLDQSFNHLYTAAKIGLVCASVVALCVYIRNAR